MEFGFRPPQQQVQEDEAVRYRTLRIGDLQDWMDLRYLIGCFDRPHEISSLEIVRNHQTGQSEGYGFITCISRAAAERILKMKNGTAMPECVHHHFRLSWATSNGEPESESGHDDTNQHTEGKLELTKNSIGEPESGHYEPNQHGEEGKLELTKTSGTSKSKAKEISHQRGNVKHEPVGKELDQSKNLTARGYGDDHLTLKMQIEDNHLPTSNKKRRLEHIQLNPDNPFCISDKKKGLEGYHLTSDKKRQIEDSSFSFSDKKTGHEDYHLIGQIEDQKKRLDDDHLTWKEKNPIPSRRLNEFIIREDEKVDGYVILLKTDRPAEDSATIDCSSNSDAGWVYPKQEEDENAFHCRFLESILEKGSYTKSIFSLDFHICRLWTTGRQAKKLADAPQVVGVVPANEYFTGTFELAVDDPVLGGWRMRRGTPMHTK